MMYKSPFKKAVLDEVPPLVHFEEHILPDGKVSSLPQMENPNKDLPPESFSISAQISAGVDLRNQPSLGSSAMSQRDNIDSLTLESSN